MQGQRPYWAACQLGKTMSNYVVLLLQILKLPAGKYTVREQEMLSSFAPQEFFSNVTHMSKGTIVASAALLGAAIFIWRQKNDEY